MTANDAPPTTASHSDVPQQPAGADALRASLGSLVHHDGHAATRARMAEIFTPERFARPSGLTDTERFTLTYERLRHLNAQLDPATPLLTQRELLFPLFEWAAYADTSLFYAFFLHHCTVIGSVVEFAGDRTDVDELLAELTSSRQIGALLMTELGHGNSNSAIRTEAVYDPETHEFVVNTPDPRGVKFPPSVGLPGINRLGVVTAQLKVAGEDRGAFCFLVPIRNTEGAHPGVRISPLTPAAMIPLDWSAVSFDHVRIPFRNWLRDSASIDADGTFHDPIPSTDVRTRQVTRVIRFVWEGAVTGLAAVTRASAVTALHHAHRRHTTGIFGTGIPVIRYRNQQHTLLTALASAYVASMIAKRLSAPEPAPLTVDSTRTTFLMKAVVDGIAERVTAECRTASGVLGFIPENRFLDYQGLAHSFNAAGLSNEMLYLNAATTMAVSLDYEPPTEEPPTADAERRLDEPAMWTGLLATRERRMHQELVTGLRRAGEKGLSKLDAWNDHVELAERLARTHATRLLLETVRAGIDSLTDAWAARLVQQLCTLYVLDDLAANDGWYLAEEVLTTDEVRAIPALRNEICENLLPHATDLADALDVPHDLVGAPISRPDYVAEFTPRDTV